MLGRHGLLSAARSVNCESRRAFTTTAALCLPRNRPEGGPSSGTNPRKHKPEQKGKEIKPKPKLLGLLERQARLDQSLQRRTSHAKGAAAKAARTSQEHHDLQSFLEFAARKKLDPESTVYKGTHYEYTVMESLKQFGFQLHRSGKSNDKGIDLIGHWDLPGEPHQIKVLVQCKVSRATPANIRELAGAYAGAPSEWQGESVLALLASSKAATKGVLQGAQASKSALGVLHVESDGLTRQFVWNHAAGQRGLAGIGVTAKYQQEQSRNPLADQGIKETIKTVTLTWNGQPFSANANAN